MRLPELEDWLRLWHVRGLGPKTYLHLLHKFDRNPRRILAAALDELIAAGLSRQLALEVTQAPPDKAAADLAWLTKDKSHQILTLGDAAYPAILREIAIPPPILYLKGSSHRIADHPCLAIVGSRKATALGKQAAFTLAEQLAALGVVIVSGLAVGIDAQAHRGALAASSGKTIAVLGHGLMQLYPQRHRALSEAIAEYGVLISEFSPGIEPRPANFPRRNRLISGLCSGVIIIEASKNSGSLITARCALEQNREIFALPGPSNSPYSEGCHRLIQEGAKLITGIEDILLECPHIRGQITTGRKLAGSYENLPRIAQQLLEILEYAPMSMDLLIEKCGLTPDQVSSMLIELEMSGHVICDTNGHYLRSASD